MPNPGAVSSLHRQCVAIEVGGVDDQVNGHVLVGGHAHVIGGRMSVADDRDRGRGARRDPVGHGERERVVADRPDSRGVRRGLGARAESVAGRWAVQGQRAAGGTGGDGEGERGELGVEAAQHDRRRRPDDVDRGVPNATGTWLTIPVTVTSGCRSSARVVVGHAHLDGEHVVGRVGVRADDFAAHHRERDPGRRCRRPSRSSRCVYRLCPGRCRWRSGRA